MKKSWFFALILLGVLLYWPGQMSLPPFDRDESRFAQASHQMVETGNYVDIRFQDEVRYKKPIGIYWLQALSVKVTGAQDSIWAYRIPSWLGAIAAVLLTGVLFSLLASPAVGLGSALLLASCLLMGVEARLAKTDAVQLATIVLAQLALARLWLGLGPARGKKEGLLFWLALGIGVLVKGPIILMVTGLTAASLSLVRRSAAWLKPLLLWQGGLLFALIVLPWLIAITIKSGGQFWVESVGKDLLAKAAGGQESHGAPPGYYLATVFLTFWPWAPLLIPAAVMAWRRRQEAAIQFLLAWLIPSWIVFEAMPTKLLHYTLPTFPVLAGLVALLLIGGRGVVSKGVWRLALGLAGLLFVGVVVAIPLAPALIAQGPDMDPALISGTEISLSGAIASTLMLLLVVGALVLRRRPALATGLGLAGLVLFYGTTYAAVMPGMNFFWVSRSLAGLVAPHRAECPGPITSLGYGEPSLVFLLGTNTKLANSWDEVTRPADRCALFLIEDHFNASMPEDFRNEAKELGKELGRAGGLNYSKGDPVALTLYRVDPRDVTP